MNRETLIELKDVHKHYPHKDTLGRHKGEVRAVDGLSFDIKKGETFGLVGESGCGKSTLGRCVLRMHPVTSGQIEYKGKDISSMSNREWEKIRSSFQVVFQDPYSALNNSWSVREIVSEPLIAAGMKKSDVEEEVRKLLPSLGLSESDMDKYPFEFSGGQRQRIGIARAIIGNPEIIFCDEAVSALDVSVRAQVLDLLKKLQHERGFTYLFTAHDLAVVRDICDRTGVMYLGSMMEVGDTEDVFTKALHPYTAALIESIPVPDPRFYKNHEIRLIQGEVPNPMDMPCGCKFSTRCPQAKDICHSKRPELTEVWEGHFVACHLYSDK